MVSAGGFSDPRLGVGAGQLEDADGEQGDDDRRNT